ncbi:MAG: N-acetylmuramoyl-L-alanine amidase [Balneola sp.]|mgnify:CR=1 FL=1
MKQIGLLFLSFIFINAVTLGQDLEESQNDSLYLNIVIPEQDTVVYSFSRYRVAANTNPGATAYINGRRAKVYSSGAFIAMIDHDSDTTDIIFRVEMGGESLSDTMMLVQPEPKKPDLSKNIISELMVEPGSDTWLEPGEALHVQFQGKPGEDAYFNINGFTDNIKMKEVSPKLVGGKEGVYRGTYYVREGDAVKDAAITFKIKKGLLGYHKRVSTFKVSFLPEPIVGVVSTDDAYLNVGLGTDRLGGTKYGTIPEGVKLNITGMQQGMYKVRLSESLDAWIPRRFVELTDEELEPVSSLTGNIRVSGNARHDLIRVTLSEKLPYITTQEIDPNKIIVDIFGATSNTNWKIKYLTSEGIESVDWEQVENDRFRLTIKLKNTQNWGYSIDYGWGAIMDIRIKRPPTLTSVLKPLTGRVIAVDAGHGGSNNGSLGAAGYQEKDVTLQISELLKAQLEEAGAEVIMTRTDDSYVYMSERREMTIETRADLLVSIHTNSIGYGSDPLEIKGTGSFYKHIAFKPLAEIMYGRMTSLGLDDYGLTGSFNFSLNAPIEFPNVLVETAFISNPEEEILLTDSDFQHKIAEQIVAGLEQFYLEHSFIESVSEMPEK